MALGVITSSVLRCRPTCLQREHPYGLITVSQIRNMQIVISPLQISRRENILFPYICKEFVFWSGSWSYSPFAIDALWHTTHHPAL